MKRDNSWLAAITGVLFLVVVIIGFIVGGDPPDIDEPAQEIVDHYVDDKDAVMVGVLLQGIATTLFVFFGGYVSRVLRNGEGDRSFLPAVAFAGVVIFAVGSAIDGTINFALAETADDIEPTAVQALAALWHNDFIPFAVGLQLFFLAMGLSAVRTGALPKWFAWFAILVGIVSVTPIGFVAFPAGGVLVIVLSVLLTLRARRVQPASQAP